MEQDREKSIALRYGHIEPALADVMAIQREDRKAFQARLRHLRNLGTPSGLPSSGKGPAIKYTKMHAFEMLIALEMQNSGQAPRRAAVIAQEMISQAQVKNIMGQHDHQNDIYSIIYPSIWDPRERRGARPQWTICEGFEKLNEELYSVRDFSTVTLINLSQSARALNEALDKIIYI